ncbi:MAG: class I SAM-dependent methyltransferase [Anaerolineales bacterium]|nr:class I SAM-dependent methyltransferase [Anaerolineales bacterium]
MKVYLTDKQALAFYKQQATSKFWDKHWSTTDLQTVLRNSVDDRLFIPAVKRHLPKESVVLEGGCGMGHIVHALQYQGYKAIGIDFASETIKNINEAVPELDVRFGDVRALDIPDASLDGYISVGVIEHFWDGYTPIINEMRRTLRPGGFLFISFPYMSPLRRLKVFLKLYPIAEKQELNGQVDTFYQFALSPSCFQADLEALGFQLKEFLTYSGLKGFKDEVSLLQPWLQEVYEGRRATHLRSRLERLFKPFASHSALLVMQKIK